MRLTLMGLMAATLVLSGGIAVAQQKYGPGVTDREIKIGQTIPYSGPASSFGIYGRIWVAYFAMLNEQGGINGRKINVLSLDNAFSPPKAVEQTRKLVEEDGVFAEMGTVGTVPNAAVQKYLNGKKAPHLLISAGGSRFNDPVNFPWSVPFYPTFDSEASVYARHILKTKPAAKIAVLYQNDDYGKDFLKGLREGLGDKAAKMIVAEAPYALTDPTIDSQILNLQASGADVLMQFVTPKFAAQAIRKTHGIGWKPAQYISSPASSIQATLTPAGVEASTGVITAQFTKLADDPRWAGDKDVVEYLAFMKKWAPGDNPNDFVGLTGYINARMAALVLERCGDDLTRDNLLKQATTLNNVSLPMLLPGITISNSPQDYAAFGRLQLAEFDGKGWKPLGELISAKAAQH